MLKLFVLRIWDYLIESTRSSKLAVIITTHYIEEAKQANRIGLMRNGILLAEDSPEQIMKVFGTPTLEDAFLILSQKQGQSEEADNTLKAITEGQTAGSSSTATSATVDSTVGSSSSVVSVPAADPASLKSGVVAALPAPAQQAVPLAAVAQQVDGAESPHSTPKMDVEYLSGQKRYLHRNLSFAEQKPPGLMSKLLFTSTTRMKALLTKNVLQLIRQPSYVLKYPMLRFNVIY